MHFEIVNLKFPIDTCVFGYNSYARVCSTPNRSRTVHMPYAQDDLGLLTLHCPRAGFVKICHLYMHYQAIVTREIEPCQHDCASSQDEK